VEALFQEEVRVYRALEEQLAEWKLLEINRLMGVELISILEVRRDSRLREAPAVKGVLNALNAQSLLWARLRGDIDSQCRVVLSTLRTHSGEIMAESQRRVEAIREQRLEVIRQINDWEARLIKLEKEVEARRARLSLIPRESISEFISEEFELRAVQGRLFELNSKIEWAHRQSFAHEQAIYQHQRVLHSTLCKFELSLEANVRTALLSLMQIKRAYHERVLRRAAKAEPRDFQEYQPILQASIRALEGLTQGLLACAEGMEAQGLAIGVYLCSLYSSEQNILSKTLTRLAEPEAAGRVLALVTQYHERCIEAIHNFNQELEEARIFTVEPSDHHELAMIRLMMQGLCRDRHAEDPVALSIANQFFKVAFAEWIHSEYFRRFLSKKVHTIINEDRPPFLEEITISSLQLRNPPEILDLKLLKSEIYQTLVRVHLRLRGPVFVQLQSQLILKNRLSPFFLRLLLQAFEAKLVICLGPSFMGDSWISFEELPVLRLKAQPFEGAVLGLLSRLPFAPSLVAFAITQAIKREALYPNRTDIELPMTKKDEKPEKIKARLQRERDRREELRRGLAKVPFYDD
jgi:hypothetical protein